MAPISYLVTVHDEDRTLEQLLKRLVDYSENGDEIVIVDDFSENPATQRVLSIYTHMDRVRLYQHSLNNDYGSHKNYGNSLCKNEWVFQVDGDECPAIDLMANVHGIVEANPTVELFFVPRINDFRGVTENHAKQWGWKLSPCPAYENRLVVNWPDYQGRIYRNIPDRIKWDRRLHEKIEGHLKFSFIPAETDLALYHDKTIETQLRTNMRYNEKFTEAENRGHKVT